jgi:threonine dehydratase
VAERTPLVEFPQNGPEVERRIFLKLESLQPMGAFKMRGAYNKIAALPEEARRRGVITYSSGNHAQAVAWAARQFGIRAVIVMPRNSPLVKQRNTAALGAEIVLVGPASSERQGRAEELAAQHGYVMVPPFNDEHVIAGQATLALEILEDLPDTETVLAPVSGGGLLSGVAAALKLSRPEVKVIGVEPELAADAGESFRSGKIVRWAAEDTARTIADGLRTQAVGEIPFQHIRAYVDDMITVTEDDILEAMRRLVWRSHVVVEPSGAVAVAALLFHADRLPRSRNNVAVVSGGNVEPELLLAILAQPARAAAQ